MNDQRRRLMAHGMLLFLLGLLLGVPVYAVANPRMGLSAHVGTVLNGVFLIAAGAAWEEAALAKRTKASAFWLLVVGSYGGCAGLALAAVLGTRLSTPLNGAAIPAGPWQEGLVNAVLSSSGGAMLLGTSLTTWSLFAPSSKAKTALPTGP
jgi:hydroxylaminobenzene mutase